MIERLIPDRTLRTEQAGQVLLGGNPFRVMRLSDRGAEQVRSWFRGGPGPTTDSEHALAERLIDAGFAHPAADPTPIRCHVVIPFKGDPSELDATIAPVRSSGAESIVVVDDGNDPPLPPMSGAQVLRHNRSRGPAAARNTGWRSIRRDDSAPDSSIIVFIDAGVTSPGIGPDDDRWLHRLGGLFRDPGVAAAAPRVASTPGSTIIHRYESLFSPLDLRDAPGMVGPGRPIPYVPSACLLVRSADLEAIGGFDEGLRFGEDVDLIWRLVAAGRTVRYEPSVVVRHEPRRTLRDLAEQRFRYASAAAPLHDRHGAAVAPWRSSALGAGGVALISLGRPLIGVLIGVTPVRALASKLDATATPNATAVRLLAEGHAWAIRSFAESAGRTWSPLVLAVAIFVPPARVAAGWMALGWLRRLRDTRSPSLLALGVIDDVAYGFGAFFGAFRNRSVRPLLPKVTRWGR